MSSPVRPSEPALVTVSLKFGSSTVGSPSQTYAVYVDGKPVGSCPYGVISAIVLPEGRHFISVRIHPWSSDVVDLDLQGGDRVDLVGPTSRACRWRLSRVGAEWGYTTVQVRAIHRQ